MTKRDIICKGCSNSGIDITGKPCICLLTPEWQREVDILRRELGNQRERVNSLLRERYALLIRHNQQKAYADASVKVNDAMREEISLLRANIQQLEAKP